MDPGSNVDFTGNTNYALQVGTARDVYYNGGLPQQAKPKPKPSTTVPFGRDKDFVHRHELDVILAMCKSSFARVGLVGLGGMGKSQLAIELSWRVREASPDTWVFWVHASNSARILESYKQIADRADIPSRDNAGNNILQLVGSWLAVEENGKWVVIVDNADDVDVLEELSHIESLPEVEHGCVLVTSRNKDAAYRLVGNYTNVVEINAMSSEDAQALFRTKCYHEHNSDRIIDLVKQLECIPLAITQAASYIQKRHPRMTISKYLEIFEHTDSAVVEELSKPLPDRRRYPTASASVIMTWQISFEHIRSKEPHAADLLSFMSLCDRQGIPEMLLLEGMEIAPNYDNLETDLETLRSYSLIKVDLSGEVFEMHRLVQLATRVWLEQKSNLEHWKAVYVQTMARIFPSGKFGTWTDCAKLYAHGQMLLKYTLARNDLLISKADALSKIGVYSLEQGQYALAMTCYDAELTARKKVSGKTDRDTLAAMNDLAIVLSRQGKHEDAEQLKRQVTTGYEELLGKNHPYALTSMNNLAITLGDQGKYEEAEQLHRQALAARQRVLGEFHPDTLTSANNLALVLQDQGKYEEAEPLNRQTLAAKEKVLGEFHPDTLTSASNLALVFQDQGKYEEAEQLNRQTLVSRERVLGKNHPDTLTSASNLASVLRDQGKYEEAEQLNRQTLVASERVLGKDHPDTLASASNLASVLRDQGKYEEAEQLNRRTLVAKERVLGEFHPDTLASASNLASVLRRQGKYEEAEQLNRQTLVARERVLGKDHPDTLISASNLASVLRDQGKYEEAEQFSRQSLAGLARVLDKDHPHVLIVLNNLVELLRYQNKHNEADRFEQALSSEEGFEQIRNLLV